MTDNIDEDATRLFVLGYVDAGELPDGDGIVVARARMSEFAIQEGLQLGSIYIDDRDTEGEKFRALMASIEQFNPAYVLVPGLGHVSYIARPGEKTKLRLIEERSGATVVVVEHPL
ncbi:hypothetical protein [Kribbella catacumbae]|uniref:hypothetical protein n=1 Tax=Kribbella catacumbae TaxID=460086 RepID=UPI00037DEEE4|nr:hypothetical protein [Kribbella catacumbae]